MAIKTHSFIKAADDELLSGVDPLLKDTVGVEGESEGREVELLLDAVICMR